MSGFLTAQTIPDSNQLNVFATSGLSLRATANSTGQMLTVIPFGESITSIETLGKNETIEWMNGEWVKVRYLHHEGYVFTGFTSMLPPPIMDFELTQEDLDLTYPLLAWAEYHFDEIRNSDTIEHDQQYSITQHLENGITIERENSDYHFKTVAHFKHNKIGEIYNLLKSMLMTKQEIVAFVNNSIFIEDIHGELSEIKITIDSPVHIKKQTDGSIKASVITFHEGCSL